MSDKYWNTISQLTGMPFCPQQGPFSAIPGGSSVGAIIGTRNGFIVAIASTLSNQQKSLKIYVRYPPVADGKTIFETLQNNAELLAILKVSSLTPHQLAEHLAVQTDSLIWK